PHATVILIQLFSSLFQPLRPPRSPLFPYTTLFRSFAGQPMEEPQRLQHRVAVQHQLAGGGIIVLAAVGHDELEEVRPRGGPVNEDRKSTRLNSSHVKISYAVFCLKKKTNVTN